MLRRTIILLVLALLAQAALASGAGAGTLDLKRLRVSVTADLPVVPRSAQNGYTITVSNPNPTTVTLLRIRDQLPDHGHGGQGVTAADELGASSTPAFTYLAGTTSGVTTSEPSIRGQHLTWRGPWTVPASGSVSLHFNVRVSDMVAVYYTTAGATADGVNVVGAKRVAEIRVIDDGPIKLAVAAGTDRACRGDNSTYTMTVRNTGSRAVTLTSFRNGLPDGTRYRPGTTSGLTSADPELNNNGHILTWDGSWQLAPGATATLRIGVTYVDAAGTVSDRLRVLYRLASGAEQDVGTGPTAPVRIRPDC